LTQTVVLRFVFSQCFQSQSFFRFLGRSFVQPLIDQLVGFSVQLFDASVKIRHIKDTKPQP